MVKANERRWEFLEVGPEDSDSVVGLIEGARWLHHHLDWMPQGGLIGKRPFVLALDEGIPVGCVAAPPETAGIAWLRLLAIASSYDLATAWQELWGHLSPMAQSEGLETIAALGITRWLPGFLEQSGFSRTESVIHLELNWLRSADVNQVRYRPAAILPDDLEQVVFVDNEAFEPIWRHSLTTLSLALEQSEYSTLIRLDDQVVAYQISTVSGHGGHLARLAVAPERQGQGLATALVKDAARYFRDLGQPRLTVNTQGSNRRSQRLYERLGFMRTGQSFPVHQFLFA